VYVLRSVEAASAVERRKKEASYMTVFTATVLGLLIGLVIRERRKAYLVWLPIWALVLLGQTVLLARTNDSVDAVYPFIQGAIVLAGAGCVWLGGRLRDHRALARTASSAPTSRGVRSSVSKRVRLGRLNTVLWLLGSAAGLMLITAGSASAQPPITGTDVSTFSESFSDEPYVCQDELYEITVSGRAVVHFTYFEDTGAVHFRQFIIGKSVGVPLDGTGPTYTATFEESDSENIRSVKNGDVLVETDTDMNRVVAQGSDGSKAFLDFHAHFTVNANGELSVAFDTTRIVCA